MGYSPWDGKELDMTKQLTHTHTHTHVGHYRELSRFFYAIQKVLISYLFYKYYCVYVNPNLPREKKILSLKLQIFFVI